MKIHSLIHVPVSILSLILIFSPLIITTEVQPLETHGSFPESSSIVQSPSSGPDDATNSFYKVIFHQKTGLCFQARPLTIPVEINRLGPCSNAEEFSYNGNFLEIPGTYACLQADQIGKPVKLALVCRETPDTKWAISDSKKHLSSKLKNGRTVCLDVDSNNVIVTNKCKCQSGGKCHPGSQWFKLIDYTQLPKK